MAKKTRAILLAFVFFVTTVSAAAQYNDIDAVLVEERHEAKGVEALSIYGSREGHEVTINGDMRVYFEYKNTTTAGPFVAMGGRLERGNASWGQTEMTIALGAFTNLWIEHASDLTVTSDNLQYGIATENREWNGQTQFDMRGSTQQMKGDLFAEVVHGNFVGTGETLRFALFDAHYEYNGNKGYVGNARDDGDDLGVLTTLYQSWAYVTVQNYSIAGSYADPKESALSGGQLLIQTKGPLRLLKDGLATETLSGSVQLRADESITAVPTKESNAGIVQGGNVSFWWMLLFLPIAFAARPPKRLVLRKQEARLEAGQYALAARKKRRLLRSKYAPRAVLTRAMALLCMGSFREANDFLSAVPQERRPDAATYHFLKANALAGLGRHEDARVQIRACLRIAPSYAEEISAIPRLSRLVHWHGESYA